MGQSSAIAEQTVSVNGLTWFYREHPPTGSSSRLPVLLLHGLVSQSYSWRQVCLPWPSRGFAPLRPRLAGPRLF
jgi:pimeloyl-ACP methyl ester carboxylesterase